MGDAASVPAVDRRADMRRGLLILFSGFAFCMALSLWAMRVSTPRPAPPPAPPSKLGISGFPNKVSVVDLIQRAKSLSVRSEFRGFAAEGIQLDGTVDLTKPGSVVRYVFQSPEGLGPQPPRKGGTLPTRTYCGRQEVVLNEAGLGAKKDMEKANCPVRTMRSLALPTECPIDELIEVAKARKLKLEGPLRVEFYESAMGPAYRLFEQQHQKLALLASDCRTVLIGKDQRGVLP